MDIKKIAYALLIISALVKLYFMYKNKGKNKGLTNYIGLIFLLILFVLVFLFTK